MAVPPKISQAKRNIVIVTIVIILAITAGVVIEVLGTTQVHVTGTYLSVWYNSPSSSGYFGPTSRSIGSSFNVTAQSIFTENLTVGNNATAPGGGAGSLSIDGIQIDQSQLYSQSLPVFRIPLVLDQLLLSSFQ